MKFCDALLKIAAASAAPDAYPRSNLLLYFDASTIVAADGDAVASWANQATPRSGVPDDVHRTDAARVDGPRPHGRSTSNSVSGEPVAGRKRILAPNDGSTQVLFNGSTLTTAPAVGTASGNGLALGAAFNATFAGSRIAFFLACSSVPDSTARAALEAKMLEDFG